MLSTNAATAAIQTGTSLHANYHPTLSQYTAGSPDLQYLAKAFVDKLNLLKDPRLTLIVAPTANSVKTIPQVLVYLGLDVALTDNDLAAVVRSHYFLASLTTCFNRTIASLIPVYVFTSADVCFLKAEAALEGRGDTAAQAATFYSDGVKAALATAPYNITTLPTAYLPELSLTGTKDQQLDKIMTQRWISLFTRSYDAYLEWRRTGYPVLLPGKNTGMTNGRIPRRSAYPSDETILNAGNYRAAADRLSNGDPCPSRTWIDM